MAHSWAAAFSILVSITCLRIDAFLPSTRVNIANTQQSGALVNHDRRKCGGPLMGIKGFRSWFESAFPTAVTQITDRSDNKNKVQPEVFDHVLIDANQYLHTTLRKAHNLKTKHNRGRTPQTGYQQHLDDELVEHALLLFLKEIKRITTTTAIPRKSLVIALDGSPAAAKLDVQRRRRYAICKKAENQERQIEALRERGWRDNDFGFYNHKFRKDKMNPVLTKHERERTSLHITPGTSFMDKVTDALLYWSWQYVTRFPRVKVYMSPSYVHGEGEIKLLDWIMHGYNEPASSTRKGLQKNVKGNETIAILGGDSDLVLLSLVVPPTVTHNIHVILPGVKGKSLVVSVWETTRRMARMIEGTVTYGSQSRKTRGRKKKRGLTLSQINQARIDTALLVIMNGNDYLQKLRGTKAGFDSFFTTYLDAVKSWLDRENGGDEDSPPFLVGLDDNGEIYLNVPFAIAFFREMALDSDVSSFTDRAEDSSSASRSELGTLMNLVEAKILPGPINFKTIRSEESYFEQELWEMNSKLDQDTDRVMDEVFAEGAEIVRLTLGHFPDDGVSNAATAAATTGQETYTTVVGESDGHGVISRMRRSVNSTKAGGRAYVFEVPHRQQFNSIKAAKYRLSCLALEEIFGIDDVEEIFGGSEGDEDDDDESNDGFCLPEQSVCPVEADAESYIAGLLWNLETYQHGCCADYSYDYGKRPSPTPQQVVEFLETVKDAGKLKITRVDLIGRSTTTPLSDGLSCLAAVPPQSWEMVPAPYNWLVQPSRGANFEELYNSCFHPETSAFNIRSFQGKCNAELSRIATQYNTTIAVAAEERGGPPNQKNDANGRRIYAGSKSWTVLSYTNIPLTHEFEPPVPFTGRVPRLRRNRKIRATKLPVKAQIPIPGDTEIDGTPDERKKLETRWNEQGSVHDVPYKTVFKNRR